MDDNENADGIQKRAQWIDTQKADIVREALDIKLELHDTDIPLSPEKATRIPLTEMPLLGAAFASLPDAFNAAGASGEVLLRATDKFGNLVDPSLLQSFKDGSGLMGSVTDAQTGFAQVRFHPVTEVANGAKGIPCDPMTLFMAAALMEINEKLNDIQETQQEMFEYIRNKDKADLRGNLETLSDVLDNYRFNWDNDQYKNNKHILVQQIRNDAEKAIIQHRAQIESKFGSKGFLHMDKDVRQKADALRDELEEYRLSVYLYAFSSFLEVMLLENFNPAYLDSTAQKADDYALRYRELYTDAYNALEADANTSMRAIALGGLSGAMGRLGKAIEKTPVGDRTSIDERLQNASRGVADFSDDAKRGMMDKVVNAHESDVRPFTDSIRKVNSLYNKPSMVIANEDAIYMLPIENEESASA